MSPKISVIIASTLGSDYLERCLSALGAQTKTISAEVIVVDRVGSPVSQLMTSRFPHIHLIESDQAQSVSQLRAVGIQAAQGEIIAITEDHCIPPADWYESIIRAHEESASPAIGGTVDNGATERLLDWAVFFCEYSNFMSPTPHGIVRDLPGPNVSYKRDALLAMQDCINDEFWETTVHESFERSGHALWSNPSVRMLHKKHFTLPGFLRERYHYSRSFAGRRKESLSLQQQLFHLLLTPLLPPVLIRRISQRVVRRRRYTGTFLKTAPYLMLFTIVWAWGEAAGYVLGAGDSGLHLE